MSDLGTGKRVKRSRSSYSASQNDFPMSQRQVDVSQSRAIAKLKRQIRKQTPETKCVFGTSSNTGVSTSGLLIAPSTVAAGDDSQSRDGLMIRPVDFQWNIILESETDDIYNVMRMIVVQSKAGVLVAADFPTVHQPISSIQTDKYKVLYDQSWLLENGTMSNGNTGATEKYNRYYKKAGSVKIPNNIWYADASSNPVRGGVFVFFVSDSAVAAHPDLEDYYGAFRFQDA